MLRISRRWTGTCSLILTFACSAAGAEEKSNWPVEQGAAGTQQSAPGMSAVQKPMEGMSNLPSGQGGMQHGGMMGGMGGMSQGPGDQGSGDGMGSMPHGSMGGMSQAQPPQGGVGGMQPGGSEGGMMGGGMMRSMPLMTEPEKEELLMKAQELDLKLDQLRSRIIQSSDEAERDRLKAEHRAVFKEYLPKLHKLMMQAHMEMKMHGGAPGQPMKSASPPTGR